MGQSDSADEPTLDLTEPERRLWAAYPTGEWVELGDRHPAAGDPAAGDPAAGASWGPERTVRGEVIATLLLGAREPVAGHVAALRLGGARIVGPIRLSGGRVDSMFRLYRCHVEEPILLTEAETRRIRITESHLHGVEANGLRADGYLSLSGCTIDGPVRLARASLSGGLRLNGTRISHSDDWALHAGAMTVGGGVLAREAEIVGGARLVGARITGDVRMEGARFEAGDGNRARYAILADNMEVADVMECSRGFSATGEIRMRGARVTGTLSFDQATLHGSGGSGTTGGGRALKLSMTNLQELILTPRERITGTVSLTQATAGVVIGRPHLWPDRLHLNGFVYDSLRPYDVPVLERISALSRHPEGFRPQPYEQLADWYRRSGRDDLARRTQLAKVRARRGTLSPGMRAASYLLDWTVGYGYRPWLAAAWFALLAIIGTATFSYDEPNPIKPADELPHFNALVFTLDLLIPIGSLGQRGSWDPTGWTQWLAITLIAAGWLLATALIAGITRVLRPT